MHQWRTFLSVLTLIAVAVSGIHAQEKPRRSITLSEAVEIFIGSGTVPDGRLATDQ